MNLRFALFGLIILLVSCKTYTITPESFKNQFVASDTTQLKNATISNPLLPFTNIKYQANNIKSLTVYDKAGVVFTLPNSPAIEMRLTLKNGKRKIFYFDTVILENDTLKGSQSRFLGLNRNVPFNEIVKIEVQDGGKNFQPVKPRKDEIISENAHKTFAEKGQTLKHSEFKMDTISVKTEKYHNLYFAKCTFEQSKSELIFIYFINNGSVELVRIRETIQHEQNNIWSMNNFYVENNKIFFEEKYCSINKEGENFKSGKYKDYKFNKNLDTKFLRKFSFNLYDKIK